MADIYEEMANSDALKGADALVAKDQKSTDTPTLSQQGHATIADKSKNRKKTAGELVFDRTVYTGIGFCVNEASSLLITDQFLNGKNLLKSAPGPLKKAGKWFSKEGFEDIAAWAAKKFNVKEKLNNKGKTITGKETAGNMMLMITLLSGGTLLVLPMRWLENSKAYWVKKANHMVDGLRGHKLSQEEITSRDMEVEQTIACSPKQSWGTLLLGRIIAMCSSVGAGTFIVGTDRNDKIKNFSENLLTGGRGVQPEGQKNFAHRIAALTGVETYSCIISSVVLEIASKFFARKKPHPRNPEICAKPVPQVAQTAPVESNATPKDEAAQNVVTLPQKTHAEKIRASVEEAPQVQHVM